ncbi:MAG: hypothetical protein RIQ33_892, partial [Bacteroidota bacterium]
MKKNPTLNKKEIELNQFNWLQYKWPILLLITIAAYLKIFRLGFTNNDDVIFIVNQHDFLADWSNFFQLFKNSVFQKNDTFYRPILMVYFMIMNHVAEPDNYIAYHLSLLVLHICNIFLVDNFLKRYIPSTENRFWLVLFFAVHPALTMTVAWIPGVNDLLLSLFCLLYFNLLDKTLNKSVPSLAQLLGLSFLFFIILFTKETGLFLPIATLLVILYNGKIKSHSKFIGISAIVGFIIFIGWYLLRKNALGSTDSSTFSIHTIEVFLHRITSITFYFSTAIAPVNLCVWPLWESANYILIFSSIIIFIGLVVLNKQRNNKLLIFGLSWMLIFLVPNFFSTTTKFVLHEHRLYMPLIGFLLMLHETILFSVGKIAVITKRFINTTIVLFFLFQISNYIPAFDNPISFNRSGILESPNNAYLNLTYGVSLSDSNKINEAIPYFRKAFELDTSTKNVRLYLARYDLIPNKKYDSAKILLLQE